MRRNGIKRSIDEEWKSKVVMETKANKLCIQLIQTLKRSNSNKCSIGSYAWFSSTLKAITYYYKSW